MTDVKITAKQTEALKRLQSGAKFDDIDGRITRGLIDKGLVTKTGKVSAKGAKLTASAA